MLDLDLRSNRLDKEQQKRRDDARKKRERELVLQREQQRREQELAARAAQKREEDEREQIARQLLEAEEQRLTGGIRFSHTLMVYRIDGEDDKIILPEDCLAELTQQDAFTRGAMMFRLQLSGRDGTQRVTHCGVREFSAPAGSVGMPKKVLDSLSLAEPTGSEKAEIKYVLLPKCTFARLQPRHNTFIEVGPVKMCLEENLRFHTALSVGDVLTVWYRGKAHELCVTEMRPESSGTLVDTDVEIDLELSQEYLRHQQQLQEQGQVGARRTGDSSGASTSTGTDTGAAGNTLRTPSPSSAGHHQAPVPTVFHTLGAGNTTGGGSRRDVTMQDVTARVESSGDADRLRALLLPEPESSTPSIAVKVKLPSGATKTRRFLHSSPVAQLFLYVALELGTVGREAPTTVAALSILQLSTRFPARALRWSDVSSAALPSAPTADQALGGWEGCLSKGPSFAELGMTGSSEAVFAALM